MICLDGIELRLPREEEYPFLVRLRNRERRWFFDQGELTNEDAAAWLSTRHDDDRLLCIVSEDVVVGTIGWVRVRAAEKVYELGRVIANYPAACTTGRDRAQVHKAMRIAFYLCIDHLFSEQCGADSIYGRTRSENGLIRKLLNAFEPRETIWPFSPLDGTFETWVLNAADWRGVRDGVSKRLGVDGTCGGAGHAPVWNNGVS